MVRGHCELATGRAASNRHQSAFPAKEAVIQLAFIAPSLQLRHPVGLQPTDLDPWGRPGPIVQPAGAVRWDTVAESDQTQVLAEAWVPVCAGMARKVIA